MRRNGKVLPLVIAVLVMAVACSSGGKSATGRGWSTVGRLHTPREAGGSGLGGGAILLPDGTVLVAGGYHSLSGKFEQDSRFFLATAEIFDPQTGKWRTTGAMSQPRFAETLVLLPKAGQVLAAGGTAGNNAVISPSAEVYDPAKGTWSFVAPMSTCRVSAGATVLPSGDVFVAGGVGCDGNALASAEIYRWSTRDWVPAASMRTARWGLSATLLADGRILVAGGRTTPSGAEPEMVTNSAEIYDPAHDTWRAAASMHVARVLHSAGLLSSGVVVVAGGHTQDPSNLHSATPTAELYDPRADTWTMTGKMNAPREEGGSIVLGDGTFLMAGGGQQASAEIYHPSTGTWVLTNPMSTIHDDAQLVMLKNGDVLVAGGFLLGSDSYKNTATAEVFHPPAS